MKKLIAVMVLVLSMASCKIPFKQEAYFLDYQKIGLGKVLLTESNSVSFDYESIGSLYVVEESGFEKERKVKKHNDDYYDNLGFRSDSPEYSYSSKGYRKASVESALRRAVGEAMESGGDAIINLKYKYEYNKQRDCWIVTGMIVRRL